MVKKELLFNNDLSKKIDSGITKLSKAVKSTLGPGGNPAIIERKNMTPLITKDGVTVARNISLKDSFENLAVQSLIEVAEKTNQVAGDGTTSAIVLAEAIYKEGLKYMDIESNNIIGLNTQIQEAANKVIDFLNKEKKIVSKNNEISHVGTISANGDAEIGDIIAEAIDKVGQDGLITVEESGGFETELRFIEGFKIDRGYISPHFITDNERKETVFNDVNIFIYDGELYTLQNFLPIAQKLVETKKPFLVIANEIKNDVLGMLVINFMKMVCKGVGVRSPGFGNTRADILQDVAILTGAKVISPGTGDKLEEATLQDVGYAKKVIIRKNETVIIGGKGSTQVIEKRVNDLKGQIANVAEHTYDRDNLRERISRLTGGAAIIGIGATTELEMKEKKDRLEDALNATRAAIEEGILPGGGIALLKALKSLKNETTLGARILSKVIEVPFKQILLNAGEPADVIKAKVFDEKFEYGFDVRKKEFGNLYELGVVDPFKVVKNALLNAVSISSLLLTCKAAIVIDETEDKKNKMPPFYVNEEME